MEKSNESRDILYVEECEVKNYYASRIIEMIEENYNVIPAEDCREGYHIFMEKSDDLDAIITDMGSENCDEEKFYVKIREKDSEIPYIAISEDDIALDGENDYRIEKKAKCSEDLTNDIYEEIKDVVFESLWYIENS